MASESASRNGGIYSRGFSSRTDWQWPLVKSEALVTLKYGKALRAGDRRVGQVPVYGTNGQCGWHDTPLASGPGVILGRKGQGPLGVEWCDSAYWVIDTAYFVTRNTDDLDLRYFYYLVKYIGLNHLKDGTSNPSLSRDTFADLLLPLPPLSEQKGNAEILGALDAKIELNRRMNETLESLARSLFKSWFVDFDPVRAKMDGRPPPGLSPATAALFPDTFEHQNGELIPTGWSLANLGNEVDLFTGFPFESRDYTDTPDAIRLVRGDNVVQGRLRWQNAKRWSSGMLEGLDDYGLQSGDVVLAMDRPWIEAGLKYAWIGNHDLPCLLVQRVARLRSNGAGIGTGLTRLLIGSPQFTQHVLAVQTRTAVPHISAAQIKSFEFVLPPSSDRRLVHRFEEIIAPLLVRFDANNAESETLAALRDALLPRLLSGELRATDTEHLTETLP